MAKEAGRVSLQYTQIEWLAADHPGENPYPMFREMPKDHQVHTEQGLLEEDFIRFGFENGRRFLPYHVQDCYDREQKKQMLDVIILENQYIKATFLPSYGGRLISLYHKELERELLFCNPVIQPANLAILDAWISGGIEWNIGQLGHTFTTSSPLFCGVMQDDEGNDFLRMYEYERCHGVFWSLDVHLLPDSRYLEVYVRIVNDNDVEVPTYWWTNTAVPECEQARIFAGTSRVIYLNMETQHYGGATMPVLPFMDQVDASYPSRFHFSEEYFFQKQDRQQAPWEAAVYQGWAFFERSSKALPYRKMFCWGNQQGGKNWKDYLSLPGQGDYIEIQAGISKTQRHGTLLQPGESLEFVQCFGGFSKGEQEYFDADWNQEREKLEKQIDALLPESEIEKALKRWSSYAGKKPERLLVYGSGFGALEVKRRQKQQKPDIPEGFYFPEDSMGAQQQAWLGLLHQGRYTESQTVPLSYMIQPEWEQLLLESIGQDTTGNAQALLQLGIMYLDQGRLEQAKDMFCQSNQLSATALCYRNLAVLEERLGHDKEARQAYRQALSVAEDLEQGLIAREFLKYLKGQKDWEEMYQCYRALPTRHQQEEHNYLLGVKAALENGDLEFVSKAFDRDYAYIRESETDLSEIWLQYHIQLVLQTKGNQLTTQQAQMMFPVPARLDFRMIQD